jgi:hypothetical protein
LTSSCREAVEVRRRHIKSHHLAADVGKISGTDELQKPTQKPTQNTQKIIVYSEMNSDELQ